MQLLIDFEATSDVAGLDPSDAGGYLLHVCKDHHAPMLNLNKARGCSWRGCVRVAATVQGGFPVCPEHSRKMQQPPGDPPKPAARRVHEEEDEENTPEIVETPRV